MGSDIVFGVAVGLWFRFGNSASTANAWQMLADQRLVAGGPEAGADNRRDQRNEKIGNVPPAREGDLTPADLSDGFFLGNALRGLVAAVTVAEPAKGRV